MTKPERSTLADRIRERMAALGLNPYSAAKRAKLGESFVRDILRGKVKQPSADRLAKLSLALECSLNFLIGEEEYDLLPTTEPHRFQIVKPSDVYGSAPIIEAHPPEEAAAKVPTLLPIRFELIADAYRKASEVSRPPLGWEAGSIPPAYRGRRSWWELQRDDTMSRFAPAGSLVQVVEMNNEEKHLIEDGDLVVITKRFASDDAMFNFVERSMRRVVYRYPDMGLWFLDYAHAEDPDSDMTDEVFRETEPTAPRRSLDDIAREIEDPEERDAMLALNARLRDGIAAQDAESIERTGQKVRRMEDAMNSEAMVQHMKEFEKRRPQLVGKVIRVLTAVDAKGGFGTTLERS